jgi:hypothetical protein
VLQRFVDDGADHVLAESASGFIDFGAIIFIVAHGVAEHAVHGLDGAWHAVGQMNLGVDSRHVAHALDVLARLELQRELAPGVGFAIREQDQLAEKDFTFERLREELVGHFVRCGSFHVRAPSKKRVRPGFTVGFLPMKMGDLLIE